MEGGRFAVGSVHAGVSRVGILLLLLLLLTSLRCFAEVIVISNEASRVQTTTRMDDDYCVAGMRNWKLVVGTNHQLKLIGGMESIWMDVKNNGLGN